MATKNSKPLDIAAMKKQAAEQIKQQKDTRPFLLVKHPDRDGDYAYRVRIDAPTAQPLPPEIAKAHPQGLPDAQCIYRTIKGKQSNITHEVVDVEVLASVNDTEAPNGKATMMLSTVLRNKLIELGAQNGKVFNVMSQGKPKGKKYYAYFVAEETNAFRPLTIKRSFLRTKPTIT